METLIKRKHTERVLVKNVNKQFKPQCCNFGKNNYVYFVDKEGRLAEASHDSHDGKEVTMRFIDQKKGEKNMFTAVSLNNGQAYFLYKKINELYWVSLKNNEKKITERKVTLPFDLNEKIPFEVFSSKGIIHVIVVSKENQLHEIGIDEKEEKITFTKKMGDLNVNGKP